MSLEKKINAVQEAGARFSNGDAMLHDMTVNQLFEEQAVRTPKSVALIFEDQQYTYHELNSKANALAHHLRKLSAGADDIIGLIVDRSPEVLIGILAILKSGAAFLPIDPAYPEARINYILNSSNAKIVLTKCCYMEKIKIDCEKINIFDQNIYNDAQENLPVINTPYDLAYVIYTSGTTGMPKGVLIEHKSVINYHYATLDLLHFSTCHTLLAVSSIAFDLSIHELLIPLLSGMCVVIAPEYALISPIALDNLICKYKVDIFLATPSRLQLFMLEKQYYPGLDNLKVLMVGAENFNSEFLKKLKKLTRAIIFNGYGPTEVTIGCAFKDLTGEDQITVGKAIDNTHFYILDEQNRQVPDNEIGELCISGTGVARGYINNEQEIRSQFIPNPFDEGSLLYKTGDNATRLENGDIKILGRNDNQIKIRGFRVDLNEIIFVLEQHPEVEAASILVKNRESSSPLLAAYVIPRNNFKSQSVRKFVSERLPEYMLPHDIISVKKFPMTANGKLDVDALSAMQVNEETPVQVEIDQNSTEYKFRSLLGKIENIKVPVFNMDLDAGLIEWQITSITFMQVIMEIENTFGFEFDLFNISLHKFPTPRRLLEYIEEKVKKQEYAQNY